ncbi:MAG: DUF3303 domain-containing protein [Alphaproteobacteria bacterium]|nr:DUF3303 domain-containing protein [Alphaproteobacteria bacterium]
MKFILTWKIPPGRYEAAAEAFLASGAPVPEGLALLGRWHVPGSAQGWALVEGDDGAAVAEHVAEWATSLELQVHPVIEDEATAGALSKVFGS